MINLLLALAAVLVLASPATAQTTMPCGTGGQTAIFGCLDWPPAMGVLTTSQAIPVSGWALSCFTAQQPADLKVVYSLGTGSGATIQTLDPSAYTVYLRGVRPDVTNVFRNLCLGVVRDYWGYTVVLHPGALPVGGTVLALRWTDPAFYGLGVNYQQVQITVVP